MLRFQSLLAHIHADTIRILIFYYFFFFDVRSRRVVYRGGDSNAGIRPSRIPLPPTKDRDVDLFSTKTLYLGKKEKVCLPRPEPFYSSYAVSILHTVCVFFLVKSF